MRPAPALSPLVLITMYIRIFTLLLIFALGQQTCSPSSDSQIENISRDTTASVNKLINLADTIEIWDSLASEPFVFHTWKVALDSILVFLPANVRLEKSTKPSPYYEGANDSITIIKIGESEIHHVKNPGLSYIDQALISDREIQFARNIRIGDSYSDIRRKLNEVNQIQKPFNKIYINYGDATSTLIFEFKDGKLYKAVFWPYTG